MWKYFCELPDFFLAWYNQAERCEMPYSQNEPPHQLVLYAIAATILTVVACCLAVRKTFSYYSTNVERWWQLSFVLFLIAMGMTKLTACL